MYALSSGRLSRVALVALATLIGLSALAFNASFAHAATGAIFTTNAACTGTNVNIFADKADVFLDGGPHHVGSAGLDDGNYWVKVTVPNGDLLGVSTSSIVHVTNGSFDQCYQLAAILSKASDPTAVGYDDTTNGGGEYKVWVSPNSTFDNGTNKTDNFKVKGSNVPPPPPQNTAEILGTKFNDLNGNGVWDSNEPGIPNWTIAISNGTATTTTTTDSNGDYAFTPLAAGNYTVCEILQSGWVQTLPGTPGNEQCYIETLGANDIVNRDFGNFQTVSISGQKFEDKSGNGVKDAGDSGIADWTIAISNGTATTTTTTDTNGNYTFPNLGPGTYTVCEVGQDGWIQTFPSSGCYIVTASSGSNASGDDFGNFKLVTLTVIKNVINNNGGTKVAGDFTLHLSATSTPSDFQGSETGTQFTLGPGSYAATETQLPGYAHTLPDANCAGTVVSGTNVTCTITNDDIAPSLTITKIVDNTNIAVGGADKTAWTLTAHGATSTVSGAGGAASDATFQAGTYTLGESTGPNYYVPSGWTCTGDVINTGNSITIGIGQTASCSITNTFMPPTRTLGFWSTHTKYTNAQFTAFFGGGMLIGNAPDKGLITNTQTNKQSQLYGAYFSSIPYKSTGAKRTALDQARMILLQQLVSAKLNCAVFGCSALVAGEITTADHDFASSTVAQILADSSLLDTFNNSDDNVAIVGNTFSATQSTSQALANKLFWDLP